MTHLIPMEKFLIKVGRAMHNRMDLSPYWAQPYQCACGLTHRLSPADRILMQGFWRVVTPCPDNETHFSLIKIKMFSFKANSSLVYKTGTKIGSECEMQLLLAMLSMLR